MANVTKPVYERLKEESRHLRGTIQEELTNSDLSFARDTTQLLKFHGIYQQDDRDIRNERRKKGGKPLYSLMVRSKIPGGKLTSGQYLAHDALADRYGNGTLRITTRQGFQFHGVLKGNVKALICEMNKKLVTTSGACGDIVRNVLGCPAPSKDRCQIKVYEYVRALSDQFLSQSSGYHEIWLNGECAASTQTEDEPIYGKAYLPRKFKIGMVFPEDNCIDVYTHDLGIVPEVERETLKGFNLLVGGGLGMSHGAKGTFPRLADPFCFVPPDELLDAAKAIVMVQRDYGDRTSRKHARMKYLIHDRGLDWFRAEVEKRFGKTLSPAHSIHWNGFDSHLGWHEDGVGRGYYGISIENGRIQDMEGFQLKTALREIVNQFKTPVHLTATQDLLVCDLKKEQLIELEQILESYGVKTPDKLSNARKFSMACPALPTCGLAITESERVLPALINALEVVLRQMNLQDEKITLRMTGCPNGCARPYSAEVALVGRAAGAYNIYLGGRFDGTRLNQLFAESIPEADVVTKLGLVFEQFKAKRKPNELFGDFCYRTGMKSLQTGS
jgi:sulfite reductase (ferredoxin)